MKYALAIVAAIWVVLPTLSCSDGDSSTQNYPIFDTAGSSQDEGASVDSSGPSGESDTMESAPDVPEPSADAGVDTGSSSADIKEGAPIIPDPGTEPSPAAWYDDGGYHGIPEKAQVMGIVMAAPGYIQGGVDPDTGNHYFVFRTGPGLIEFPVSLKNKSSQIDFVHMHLGTGLVLGPEVQPIEVLSPTNAEWLLEPDTIYVLEVHSPGGGFF